MVWGCIIYHGVGPSVFVAEISIVINYIEPLDANLCGLLMLLPSILAEDNVGPISETTMPRFADLLDLETGTEAGMTFGLFSSDRHRAQI